MDIKQIELLVKEAQQLQLQNQQILKRYSFQQLAKIYNGIGPAAFPEPLRDAISQIHPSLTTVALIHDVQWHQTDMKKETFSASNQRFKRNGYKIATAKFSWYNPRRYLVMNNARCFGNLCEAFGWLAYNTPCTCQVCKEKKQEKI